VSDVFAVMPEVRRCLDEAARIQVEWKASGGTKIIAWSPAAALLYGQAQGMLLAAEILSKPEVAPVDLARHVEPVH
jgi:hypothetical protein